MFKISAAILALTLPAGMSHAASLLDFETGFSGDTTSIFGDEFESAFGVIFASPNGLNIVKVGAPADGFFPNDTPFDAGALGTFFLTSDFGTTTSILIDYTSGVTEASFDVADIDGSGTQLEEFTFVARDKDGNALSSRTVTGNDTTEDGEVIRIGFGGLPALIEQIEISGMTAGGTRRIGVALDNFTASITPVPLPSGLPLLAAGIGALGFLRSRRRS